MTCSLIVSAFPSALSTLVVLVLRASLRYTLCPPTYREAGPTGFYRLIFCLVNALSELRKLCCLPVGYYKDLSCGVSSFLILSAFIAFAQLLLMYLVSAGHS